MSGGGVAVRSAGFYGFGLRACRLIVFSFLVLCAGVPCGWDLALRC